MFVFPDCNGNNKQKYAKILIVLFTKWGFTIRYSTSKINVFESRHGLSSDNNYYSELYFFYKENLLTSINYQKNPALPMPQL